MTLLRRNIQHYFSKHNRHYGTGSQLLRNRKSTPKQLVLLRHIWTFAIYGLALNTMIFCYFKGVTYTVYVALTLCYKLISFLHWYWTLQVNSIV